VFKGFGIRSACGAVRAWQANLSVGAGFASALLLFWPGNAQADEWWGRDKALHFTLSIGLSSGAYALSAPFTERREYRVITAAGASLAIGAAKEGYDAFGYGDPSWRDFAWDVAGTAVGVMIAYAVDSILADPPHRRTNTATATSPLVITF